MNLVEPIKQGIIEALKAIGISIMNWSMAFLDQFLLYILIFIILANVVGFKGFNKFAGLVILVWIILKVVVV